jgi:hypothetical protein
VSAPALELLLPDVCRESVGLCRDFDSHAGCFLNILQHPQKAGEFNYIAGYFICRVWHCECIKAIRGMAEAD